MEVIGPVLNTPSKTADHVILQLLHHPFADSLAIVGGRLPILINSRWRGVGGRLPIRLGCPGLFSPPLYPPLTLALNL